jgi:hypothetical protein
MPTWSAECNWAHSASSKQIEAVGVEITQACSKLALMGHAGWRSIRVGTLPRTLQSPWAELRRKPVI